MEIPLHVLIQASGPEQAMASAMPKALHPVGEIPLLDWALTLAESLAPATIHTILADDPRITRQFESRTRFVPDDSGTDAGPAASRIVSRLSGLAGCLLLLRGDMPLLTRATLAGLVSGHRPGFGVCSLLGAGKIPAGIGPEEDGAAGSRPAADGHRLTESASAAEVFLMDAALFRDEFNRIGRAEMSWRDFLARLTGSVPSPGRSVENFPLADPVEMLIVQNRADLALAERILRRRTAAHWMSAGVTIHDPDRVSIGPGVELEPDVTLYPEVTLRGRTRVASGSVLLPGSFLENAILERNVRVEYSVIRDSTVREGTTVGPFAHIRGGACVGPLNRVGNFVEIKKTTTGSGTKAAHLAYLGDATIGAGVNVGAGTITCNYDGAQKHPTVIEDGAFIGSDSILVAPLRVGRGAYVGAGSTITEDVPADSLAVARGRQRNIEGWARKRREKMAEPASPQADTPPAEPKSQSD